MNSKERILTVLNGEIPDQVPYTELGGVDSNLIYKHYGIEPAGRITQAAWIGKLPGWRNLFKKAVSSSKFMTDTTIKNVEAYRKMGMDAVPVAIGLLPISNPTRQKKINGIPANKFQFPKFPEFVDECGRHMRFVPTAFETDMMFYIDGVLTSEELYDAWGKPDPHDPVRMQIYDNVMKYVKEQGEDKQPYVIPAVFGINEVTWEGLSYKFFVRSLRKNRAFIRRVLDDRMNWAIEMIKDLADHGAQSVLFYDDLGYKEGPMVNPKDFHEDFTPRLKNIVNTAHKRDMKIIMHSCGNLKLLWKDLMDTGIDALHPIEPTAKMDIFELKKQNPDLVFIGNVSPQDLQDKSPEYIRTYTTKLMTECKENGHFILGSGHSINPAVKVDNYVAMREVHSKLAPY